MSELRSSWEEKQADYKAGDKRLQKWMYVWELEAALTELDPHDWVQVNQVGNVTVFSEHHPYWVIDFHIAKLDKFDEEE